MATTGSESPEHHPGWWMSSSQRVHGGVDGREPAAGVRRQAWSLWDKGKCTRVPATNWRRSRTTGKPSPAAFTGWGRWGGETPDRRHRSHQVWMRRRRKIALARPWRDLSEPFRTEAGVGDDPTDHISDFSTPRGRVATENTGCQLHLDFIVFNV